MDNNQYLNHSQDSPLQGASLPVSDLPGSYSSGGAPPFGVSSLQGQISSLPPEANDIDLIEKEWVTHLKYIVTSTAGNPYLQQLEISKAKADYMRKRYNKDVKVAEG